MNEQELLIELLLPLFENPKYPGWKGIATKLLNQEECIVAGYNCIWIGGVGNFITLESNTTFIGCNKYIFNYDSFIKSKWVEEYLHSKLNLLNKEIKNHVDEIKILSDKYQICHKLLKN